MPSDTPEKLEKIDLWLNDKESRKFVDEMLQALRQKPDYDHYLAVGDHIMHWFTGVVREHVATATEQARLQGQQEAYEDCGSKGGNLYVVKAYAKAQAAKLAELTEKCDSCGGDHVTGDCSW